MTYRIELTKKALKQLESLNKGIQKRIAKRVDRLAENPRPRGSTKLSGNSEAYRIRVGDYRVLYEIHDDRLVVLVVKIGHRREVYRTA